MSLDNFIPAIWSGSILRNLHKALVYAQPGVINSDYEGEITDVGDTVVINNIGPVTISDYTKNTNLSDPEELSSAQQRLVIDQAKTYNFQIDDIDKAQTKPKVMQEASIEAGYGLANVEDRYVAGLYPQFDAANAIGSDGSPIVVTTTSTELAYDLFVDLKVKLDVANVPQDGRWVIVPAWYGGLLLKDKRFVDYGTAANRAAAATGMINGMPDGPLNGQIGVAAGFNILQSNNVPTTNSGANYKIIAGHRMAWTKADQIVKTEAYRPEKRFADALKGLNVYGAKVIRTNCGAVLTAAQS